MGRMGSPQASVRSAQMPKHARGVRCLPQSRRRRSMSISKARALAAPLIHAGPRPESIGGSVHRRSTSFLGRITGPHPLPSRQFQALFDSLFKVLFIFPSRYLFAIGLSPVFSLRRNSPPDLGCIPKQPDSYIAPCGAIGSRHNGALTLSGAPFEGTWTRGPGVRDARRAVPTMGKRVELQSLLAAISVDVDSHLGQQRVQGAREASICPATTAHLMIEARCEGGNAMRDAQADVPSA
ncbi:hypothetical protein CQW23_33752 [Capsicum baccatum]|uniref:Protein TAR1 n=1 Tax=Capsicum baccatum TaxID=33114 RepID=A0A2G2V0V0_CAPBA|nr:hypothetical protein CQW23_33752 [Capsicum baccatum]